ncbi:hypothetical protein [Erythrobacter sp. EC-HK427]|uniref:hypothetical protein n=1 Tax=Erythrobacter sp. EC-HK427 TaxID=2038396 RepID=UPI001255C52B|nr:hypothetical protein [Erythrobacter sp. EC-HK427]VVS96785.1 conserved hypothetical protein [Erythrobacter sp. EC-HK427]
MGELAILIPILGVSIPIIAIWTSHQRKMAEMRIGATAEETAERAAQYASKVQQLEDRVQVLERIVTDRGYDIATQIEALRDTRSVEQVDSGVPISFGKQENV